MLTDKNPLTYVLTTVKLDATGYRWLAELSLYDFSIKYRPGLKNGDADGLSRRSVITEKEVLSICNGISAQEPPQVGIIQVSKVQSVNWQRRQNADEAIKLIASFVEMGRKPPYGEWSSLPEEMKILKISKDLWCQRHFEWVVLRCRTPVTRGNPETFKVTVLVVLLMKVQVNKMVRGCH